MFVGIIIFGFIFFYLPGLLAEVHAFHFLIKKKEKELIWRWLTPHKLFLHILVGVPMMSIMIIMIVFEPAESRLSLFQHMIADVEIEYGGEKNINFMYAYYYGIAKIFGITMEI